jgi:hypothetical protein
MSASLTLVRVVAPMTFLISCADSGVGGEGKLADDERYLIVGELAAEQGNQRNVVVLRLTWPPR